MKKYRVRGRYDLWRGVWRVVRSNVPDLAIEAATGEAFEAEIERVCAEQAAGRDYQVSVVTTSKSLWILDPRFGKRVLMNGTLVPREQVHEVEARYNAAG
ncbi:MAG: hypothetical protein M3Q83_04630 [Pseudomonadota bacterium]|nr:hypothetical protein [Pseudomonadota bacterium]